MRTNNIFYFLTFIAFALASCDDSSYPRPRGELRLEYPEAKYELYYHPDSIFSFEKSNQAKVQYKNLNWINLNYPKMRATLHLTYTDITDNYPELIKEIEKITYKHSVRASGILEKVYENPSQNTKGMLYEVQGNAASNIQFYLTDSVKNLLSASLYFYSSPNSDSLQPAVDYIKKDIIALMETLKWKQQDSLKIPETELITPQYE